MTSEDQSPEDSFLDIVKGLIGDQEIVQLKFANQFDCEAGGKHMPPEYSFAQHVGATAMQLKTRLDDMAEKAKEASEDGTKVVVPYALFEIHFTTHGMYVLPSEYVQEWIAHIVEEDGHDEEWVKKVFETAMYRVLIVNAIEKYNKIIPGSYRLLNLGSN